MRPIAALALMFFVTGGAFGHGPPCVSGINHSNVPSATEDQAYCFWYSEAPEFGNRPETWDYLELFVRNSTSPMTLAIAVNGARRILQDNLPNISSGTLARAAVVLKEAHTINDPRVQASATSALLSLGPRAEPEATQYKTELLNRYWANDLDSYYITGSWGSIMDVAELLKFCEATIDRKVDHRSLYLAVKDIASQVEAHPEISQGLASEIIAHLKKVMKTKEFGFAARITAAETLRLLKAIGPEALYKFTLGTISDPGELSDTYERYSYGLRVYQVVMGERTGYDGAIRIAVQKYHIDRDAEETAKRNASSSNRESQIFFEKLKAYR